MGVTIQCRFLEFADQEGKGSSLTTQGLCTKKTVSVEAAFLIEYCEASAGLWVFVPLVNTFPH